MTGHLELVLGQIFGIQAKKGHKIANFEKENSIRKLHFGKNGVRNSSRFFDNGEQIRKAKNLTLVPCESCS